jgi:hypothetical protein
VDRVQTLRRGGLRCRTFLLTGRIPRCVLAVIGALGFVQPPCVFASDYICSRVKEWIGFRLLSSTAGQPKKQHFAGLSDDEYEQLSKTTSDGKTLHGYRLKAQGAAVEGAILVVQGNAHTASSLLIDMKKAAGQRLDVLAYDFRGFGVSQDAGAATFKYIIDDYRELIHDFLRSARYKRKLLYGMSFGGVVLLNALSGAEPVDLLVLDSVPDDLERFGCPEQYHPRARLAGMQMSVALLVAGKDSVVKPESQAALTTLVRSRSGWTLAQEPDLYHPFTPDVDQGPRIRFLANVMGTQ